ncbi:tRNA N(3)-methylcytidine methyltransferase METTL6-like [Homarus americanus]|uniref:tRNA N(3)-methylcytidine methyltransferase n=1 Tax=Homarus americanus TaxID=6706 RepID=A0A8J5TJY4_HOMAM|nr:tRNA N(3)-methylcytidine methyltransferase METTL6-like [Homarus americanus]XP_042213787.1 tRNA N(3)-methylcytidine methyltransferase METTL6-like [Homarus americanus]XP_042213788.1 tRNA N(3)-methylcytidine methyltransferase METTL6-like [Homarus americanus]XP_042213789.1 tRNA N(3)-methylcytidine methyltransferase METTL6-like [Homarus americanus]XP_042213790.1 tRNA N(3)-methylcytidine methyltransferase METTL6-like [Homarus americanus]XP_042213791.1 tRNA N(3)-methylcytidine methyltransferase ME
MSEPGLDSPEKESEVGHYLRTLLESEVEGLLRQDSRGLVGEFRQQKLEREAAKNWDKFYKRNETRFFKDRHWTTREFQELIGDGETTRTLIEVGCGVGNFLYPLLEENLNLFVYACDFSPRAIRLVKSHPKYDESKVKAFECDITKEELRSITGNEVDIISLIFVLSALHPEKFKEVVSNLYRCLKPGGMVLVRDYGLYDMAMLRFGPGNKLGERFYVRQDGTRSYYFTEEELRQLFEGSGFVVSSNHYVSRQTVNKKEGINARRIFIQAKFMKPS